MDPMPRDRVVAPDEPSGEVGNNPVLIVETDLEMEQGWLIIHIQDWMHISKRRFWVLALQEPVTQR